MKMYYNGLTFCEIDGEPVCIVHDDASVMEIASEEEGDALLENGDIEDYVVPDLFRHRILDERGAQALRSSFAIDNSNNS